MFTAPHEGLYLFTSQTCARANYFAYTGLSKDGVILQTSVMVDSTFIACSSMQASVELRIGERVWVQGTGASFITEETAMRSSFSGMFIK